MDVLLILCINYLIKNKRKFEDNFLQKKSMFFQSQNRKSRYLIKKKMIVNHGSVKEKHS